MQGRVLKRDRGTVLAIALLALAAPGVAAAASGGDAITLRDATPLRQTASLTFSSTRPGTATGSTTAINWLSADPANPDGKPAAIETVIFRYPDGTTINTSAIAQCTASDAELTLRGADACNPPDTPTGTPPPSLLGSGELVSDTGSPDPTTRHATNTLTAFNNAGEVVFLAETASPQTRVVSRATVDRNTVTAHYPTLPGAPGPEPYLAYNSLRLTGGPAVGPGAYMTTPPSCPASVWTGSIIFIYRDGVVQEVPTSTPCAEPSTTTTLPPDARPKIRIAGLPERKCTKGSFVAKVRIVHAGTPRLVAVYFDGRKAGVTQQTRFKLRVHTEGLKRGVHKLRLRVVGENGRKASKTAAFRRC
jgi:hypothetical protein